MELLQKREKKVEELKLMLDTVGLGSLKDSAQDKLENPLDQGAKSAEQDFKLAQKRLSKSSDKTMHKTSRENKTSMEQSSSQSLVVVGNYFRSALF